MAKSDTKDLEEDLKKMFPPYTVRISAPYASYIEYGTDPCPVSKEGIQELKWTHRKPNLPQEEAKKGRM